MYKHDSGVVTASWHLIKKMRLAEIDCYCHLISVKACTYTMRFKYYILAHRFDRGLQKPELQIII